MKDLNIILFGLISIGLINCQSNRSNPEKISAESLQGTWELVSYIDANDENGEWKKYNDDVIYYKHITPTHFSWVYYEKSSDRTIGTGGGTYTYHDGTYTENIKYFFPAGSSELGQSIPFTAEFRDGQWYHKGYAKQMEIDINTGKMVFTDSTKIEEIWQLVPTPGDEENEIIGSWKLMSYREQNDSMFIEYPEFVGYIKLITPTHFNWVHFNKEGHEVYGQGGGRYKIEDGRYVEYLDYMFPKGTHQVGTVLPFSMDINNNRWHHFGYIKILDDHNPPERAIVVDSSKIDEIWIRIG